MVNRRLIAACLVAQAACVTGCGLTAAQSGWLAFGGATGTLSVSPSNDLEQIYYIGIFDPREQVPQTIYRVRVRGQASALNQMKFATGWVHADLIDSLASSSIGLPKDLEGLPN